MPRHEIEEFAKTLVEQVRDQAVSSCDINLRPEARSMTAKRWRRAGVVKNAQTEVLIPDCVDAALFFLLNAIDQGVLRLQFTAADGNVVDLTNDGNGELAGWYSGQGGWRSRFSGERIPDQSSPTT